MMFFGVLLANSIKLIYIGKNGTFCGGFDINVFQKVQQTGMGLLVIAYS